MYVYRQVFSSHCASGFAGSRHFGDVDFLYMYVYIYICAYGCLRMCFYAFLQNFAKTMSPANLTIIARSASKFCARSRSQCLKMCRLDLKCHNIPGSLEPSSECQSNPAPGCEVRKLYTKYADGTPAKMRNAKILLVAESI